LTAIRDLKASFNRKARPECPSCGQWTPWILDDDWVVELRPAESAPRVQRSDDDPFVDGIKTIAMVCEKCGFVRLHAVAVLDGTYRPESLG
jgi:hypothetical protein